MALGQIQNTIVCPVTGFSLVRSVGQTIHRVAQTKYGSLDPPARSGDDPTEWSRWDTRGRTIYGGSDPVGAFMEVIEYIRPDPSQAALSEFFDDVDAEDQDTFAAQIAYELPRHGAMPYRSISKGWREIRSLYELTLPPEGWFIDVGTAESISALKANLEPLLSAHGVDSLTLSELTDSSANFKPLTTGIAEWVRTTVTLHDGSTPHGFVYPSKWGTNKTNWAVWLRRRDDETGRDSISVADASQIGVHTAALVTAAKLRGMTIY